MNKAVFLDRDGTINADYGYVYKLEDLVILPGVVEALQLFQSAGYLLIIISNQSGIGREYFTTEDAAVFNEGLIKRLAQHNILITNIYTCPHSPEENCICRKPSPYFIREAIRQYNIDPSQSFMFGDKNSDVQCGENAHIRSYLVTEEHPLIYWSKLLNE